MALFVNITNPALEDFEKTALSKPVAAAAAILDVFSGIGFKINQILCIGNYGEEAAEIVKTHASTVPTNSQITLAAAVKFSHSTNTPIKLMPFDKWRIYQSNDGGINYNLVDTIDIRPDSVQTVYISPATAIVKFKVASYNSVTSLEGNLSEAIDGTGLDFSSLGTVLDRVYDLYTDPNQKFIKSDDVLLNYLNEGYFDLWVRMTGLGQGYGVKKTGTAGDPDISMVSGQTLYNWFSDLLRPVKIAMDYSNGGKFYPAKKYDPLLVIDEDTFSETDPRYALYHDNFEINPKPKSSSGKIRMWYVFMPLPLTGITEKPKLPAVSLTTKLLVDFCIARVYEKAYKPERASYFLQSFENGTTAWLTAISRRDSGFPDAVHSFGEDLEEGSNVVY